MSELGDEDYERLLAFRNELRRFLHWSEEAAGETGLTPALHQLLLAIRGHRGGEPPSVGDAATALRMRHNSAVELAQRGEAAGLLTRERDILDGRRVRLALTELGRERLEQLTRAHLPRIAALADTLEDAVRTETRAETETGTGKARGQATKRSARPGRPE